MHFITLFTILIRMMNSLNFHIHHYDCVDSTNTLLKALAREGAPEGTVIISRSQTQGRGRLGRSFFSEDGCGIYLSLLLRPNIPVESASLITCLAAVAVARTLDGYSPLPLKIKWVNDVYLGGCKLCGILTESATDSVGTLDYVVVGIGINLCAPKSGFPDSIRDIATALFWDRQTALDNYEKIIGELLKEFSSLYLSFDTGGFIEEYIARSMLIGQRVNLVQGDSTRPCLVTGIDKKCRLEVEFQDGKMEVISHGEAVSLRRS